MVGKWESGKVLAGGYVEAKVWEWELGSGATRGRMPRYGASRVARSRGSSDFSLDRNMTDLIALLKITITGKISLPFFPPLKSGNPETCYDTVCTVPVHSNYLPTDANSETAPHPRL